jgi:hypothetical protein
MRPLILGGPISDDPKAFQDWVKQAMAEIESSSNDGVETVFDGFTINTYTVTRTLSPATATATDVANVLATLISDIKARGAKRA